MDINPDSEIVVYCDCGAKYKFAGSHLEDAIECAMCGRRVRAKGNKGQRVGAPERTALEAYAAHHGDEEKVARAVHAAREHKYHEALGIYNEVLQTHPHLRDTFYGMGYCYSRIGDPVRALALLHLAHQCGHVSAADLIRKIEASQGGQQEGPG